MSLSTVRADRDERLWSNIAVRMLVNTVSHPIEYAKVLIQIGHEPIAPWETRTLFFRRPALGLPNIFQYVRYIKSVDGFTGCYRGLVPKLCAYTISAVAIEKASESKIFIEVFSPPDPKRSDEDIDDLPDDERTAAYTRELLKEIVSRVIGIIASHPFDVITLRTMAQFVGGETKYNGLFQSIGQVYRDSGITGYYAGLVPRLIANVSTIALVSASTYVINKYFVKDKDLRTYTNATMTFLATTITYPFLVVYHCMAVNDCGLVAGLPPQMPLYPTWVDCWRHLSAINQLKRGSTLLWRYYTGPQVIINGRPIALNKSNLYKQE